MYRIGQAAKVRGVTPKTLLVWEKQGKVHPIHTPASQQVEKQSDGSVLFRLHIAVTPQFVNWLLYYSAG